MKIRRSIRNCMIALAAVILVNTAIPQQSIYAAQPTKQAGTGTYKSSSNGFYAFEGYSMMFGGYTTSVSHADAAVIHSSETTTARYTSGYTVRVLTGNERRAQGSVRFLSSAGTYLWFNYEIRINPANFNKNSTVRGRSLLDNLYQEGGMNKADLDNKLANGGTAWINAITSVRLSSQAHSTVRAGRVWSQGSGNYTAPTRSYTRSDAATAVKLSTYSQNVIKSLYDNQFTLPKIEEVDDTPPNLVSNSVSATYASGTTYWVRPNVQATVTIRQRDAGSGNRFQYLRIGGDVARSRHDFPNAATDNNKHKTSADVSIDSANRTEKTATHGTVQWKVKPLKDNLNYTLYYYFTDNKGNTIGYNSLGKNLRSDGTAPSHNATTLTGAQYVSGSTHWVRPNTAMTLSLRQHDGGSGNRQQYMKISGGTSEVRGVHVYSGTATNMGTVSTFPTSIADITLNSVSRTESTAYGKVDWRITPKVSGKTFTPMFHYTDNLGNANGYDTGSGNTGVVIKTDGVAPTVSFGKNGSSTYNSSHSTTVSVSDTLSGVKTRQYVWTTNTTQPTSGWTNFSNGATLTTPAGTGDKYLWIKAADNVGNEQVTRSNVFKVDQTPPTASLTQTPTAWTNGNVTLRFDNFKDNDGVFVAVGPDGKGGIDLDYIQYVATSNGTYTFELMDFSGNFATRSITVTNIDKTKPSVSFGTNGDSTYKKSHSTKVTVSDSGSGVNTTQYAWTTNTTQPTSGWANFTNGGTLSTPSSTGDKYLWVKATDKAGNEQISRSNLFRVDITIPSGSISHSPTGWTNGNVTINVSGLADSHSGYYRTQKPDGAYVTSTSFTHVVSSNGTYNFVVHDNAGNSRTLTRSITNIDKIAPTVSYGTNGNSTYAQSHSTTVTVADSGGSGVSTRQYAWSTSNTTTPTSWTNFTSGATISTPTSTGSHYLWVRVTDGAGNVTTTKSNVFRVDRTVPTSSTSQSTTAWTNGNVTMNLTSIADTGGSGYYRTKLPNGTFVTTTTASQVATSNGTYSFIIYDNAGNSTTKTFNITNIDKTVPTVSYGTNGNSTYRQSHSTTVTVADSGGSGVATRQYAWSTSNTTTPTSWTNFTSGATLSTPTSTGSHYLWIRVTDGAGNSTTTKTNVFRVDRTLPTFSASPTNGAWKTTPHVVTPTYGDSHSGVATRQYAWSTSTTAPTTWVNYSSGTLTQPGVGTYYLHYKVVDSAGNTTQSYVGPYRYETTKPTGTLTQTPTGWTNGNVTLNLASIADGGGSAYYRTQLPNGSFVTTTTASQVVTANGSYSFIIYDNAGNSTTLTRSVTNIDKTAPTVSYGTNGNSTYAQSHSTTVTVADSGGSGVATRQYAWSTSNTVTPTAWTNFTSGATLSTPTSTGSHYLWVRVTDGAGNVTTTKSNVFRVDRTAPTSSTSQSTTAWTNGNVTMNLTSIADTGGSGYYRTKLPNGTFVTTTTASQVATSNGTYSFVIYDNAGNSTTKTFNITNIDKAAPTVSYGTNGNSTYAQSHSTTVTVADSGGSGVATRQYAWSTSNSTTPTSWTNFTSGATLSAPTSTGDHYLWVKVTDGAGNTTTTKSNVFKVDRTAPTFSANPTSGTWKTTAYVVTPTYGDGHAGVATRQYAWSTSTTAPTTWTNYSSGTLTQPGVGTYYLHYKVVDGAGNTTQSHVGPYRYETTKPTGTLTQTPTGWTNGNVTLNLASIADAGGSGYYRTKLPNGSYVSTTTASQTVTANGTYSFVIYDNAGNSTTLTQTVTNIDKVNPTAALTQTPTTWTNGNVMVSVNGSDASSGVQSIQMKDTSELNGRNFVRNGGLDYKTVSLGWDSKLNGNLAPTGYWSSGYNSGVSSPTIGYHAHINTSKFGYPVFTYPNKNSQFGMKNRWLGISQSFGANSLLGKQLKVGQKLTVSFELYSDKAGGEIYGGMYRVSKSTGSHSFPSQGTAKSTQANKWERVSFEQTVDANWDLSQVFYIYLYGSREDAEATKWIKNLKLELGDTPTGFTLAPEDVPMASSKSSFEISGNGKYDFLVTDKAGNSITETLNVTNIDKTNPTGSINYSTTAPTNQDVTITLNASDSGSGVKSIQLPNGTNVNAATASFTVSKNGTYDFVITDRADNKTTVTAKVNNIDKIPPSVTLLPSTKYWTNNVIYITALASDDGGIREIVLPDGKVVKNSRATFVATGNGTYKFIVYDAVGNSTTKNIVVENFDNSKPSVSIEKKSETTNKIDIEFKYGDN